MRDRPSSFTPAELAQWQAGIDQANRNNIWCHCRDCEAEWVDSTETASCRICGSQRVEHISCWQFPDD